MDNNKSTSLFKSLGVLLLVILGLWLVYSLVAGTGYGFSMGYNGTSEGGHFYMGYGNGYGLLGGLSLILLVLLKVLFVLFIIGAVVGAFIAVKNYVFTKEEIEKIKSSFSTKKTEDTKIFCTDCGKEVSKDWKLCPYCGKELKNNTIPRR